MVSIRFGSNPRPAAPPSNVSSDLLGVPGGVATLSPLDGKIMRSQVRMAPETADKFDKFEAKLAAVGVFPDADPGDLTLIFDNRLI